MSDSFQGIAIIGMAGQFPGAKTVTEFWRNLRDGRESISFFEDEELIAAGVDPSLVHSPSYVKANPVLDGIDQFDADFFDLSPIEAAVTDPQHRLFLESSWSALEHAGYDPSAYEGWIGVYAGGHLSTYLLRSLIDHRSYIENAIGWYALGIGNDKDYIPTRISYKMNLKGPSVNVSTACSTSLVAVHLACQGLLSYQCDMALAGGVCILVPHITGYLQEDGFVSPDGHCRTFDAKAQGTVFGSGLGVVVLKRLEDALADGDYIYAVIKGSAINNDGSHKVGFTAPSVDGQAKVIAEAQDFAGFDPETISYIEAHGTGTPMGDPIEVRALQKAFNTQKREFCAIGSAKTNVGHLNCASGITGLIKTTMALHHKQLPPSLNFEAPNPEIDFANTPFYVNTQLVDWQRNGAPRRAGVSSFGFGGTNAHVVLEEAPSLSASGPSRPWQLLLLSAKTASALETATTNLANHLQQHPHLNLADVAYTLQVGRQAFPYRRVLVGQTSEAASNALTTLDPQQVYTGRPSEDDRAVAFLFSGQGSQYVQMTRGLYEQESIFQDWIDRGAEFLMPHIGLDLRHILYPLTDSAETASQTLQQTAIAQPALFVIEYALSQLWRSWGVHPSAMIGHSVGEYVAAAIAGVFTWEVGLSLVATRGRLMQSMPPGGMLAVSSTEAQLQTYLNSDVTLAVVNAPASCVLSGTLEAIAALEAKLDTEGIDHRRLHTSHAFHSPMMEPMLAAFTSHVQQVTLKPPQVPFISNVTGAWITPEQATNPDYWATHLRQTVRFAEGLQVLQQDATLVLLEVGPGRTLSKLARMQAPKTSSEQPIFHSVRHPREHQPDLAVLLRTLGRLWLAGVQIDWNGFYQPEQRRRVPLPTYPFERKRYWFDRLAATPFERQRYWFDRLTPTEPTLPVISAQDPWQTSDASTSTVPIPAHKKSDIANWFYLPSWKRATLPAQTSSQAVSGCWLVWLDKCGLGLDLAKQLDQRGGTIILVKAGEQFGQDDHYSYTLNPHRPEDYDALLQALMSQGLEPFHLVHLWSVETPERPLTESDLNTIQSRGFYSLLFLAQAIGKQRFSHDLQITVITNQVQAVTGEESLCPEKAILLGALKVIPQEYPNLHGRNIDVVLTTPSNSAALVDQLVTELTTPIVNDLIAYRGRHRWVQTFEPTPLDSNESPGLRQGGVYLITGGLGAIGLTLAEYLAETVRAKLVLTGRSALPARDDWSSCLATGDESASTNRKLRQLLALEASGAEVMVIQADVSDGEQMKAAIAQAQSQFGPINGVIHAAGVLGDGAIQRKTIEQVEQVFAPKIKGTQVLETLLADVPLDFFILCSSGAAVRPLFGQVAYAAANTFLDAFAHFKTATTSCLTTSINWYAWQGEGMGVEGTKWLTDRLVPVVPSMQSVDHPLIQQVRVEGNQVIYLSRLSSQQHWVLAEHQLMGQPTLPGTAYLELVRAAYAEHTGRTCCEFKEVTFLRPLTVSEQDEINLCIQLTPDNDGLEFVVTSTSSDGGEQEQVHAKGLIAALTKSAMKSQDLSVIEARCQGSRQTDFTSELTSEYLVLGPRWRSIKYLQFVADEGFGQFELPQAYLSDLDDYRLHPALLDSAVSFFSGMFSDRLLPLAYKRLRYYAPLPAKIYTHIRALESNHETTGILRFQITLFDEQGNVLVDIEDYTLRQIEADTSTPASPPPANGYLTIATPGELDTFTYQAMPRPAPGPGEVEIAVRATGINFQEVLIALGMLTPPDAAFKFGYECAGTITQVGDGVAQFVVGDEVMAFGSSCFSPFVITKAALIAPKPSSLTFEQAATIPITFSTAYLALIHQGRLCSGETVLIHAAAGGVGMAAVQIAQSVGATILATAGSVEKRDYLRSLGIEHVFDSRSLDFAEAVMRCTHGRGVDMVLNSLSGEFMDKSLSVLARYGRFLELGLRDILNNRPLGLLPFRHNLSFMAVHLDRDLPNFQTLWQTVFQQVQDETLRPLPHRVFKVAEITDAFTYMAQAKHIGKVVISLPDSAELLDQITANSSSTEPKTPKAENTVGMAAALTSTVGNAALASTVGNAEAQSVVSAESNFQDWLSPSEGVEVFHRVLNRGLPQVLIFPCESKGSLDSSQSPFSSHGLLDLDGALLSEASASLITQHSRPDLNNAYVAPEDEVEKVIASVWQSTLGIQDIGVHDNFFDLGGDSLLAVQVRSKLQRQLNQDLAVADTFQYPTIHSLASYLKGQSSDISDLQQLNERVDRLQAAIAADEALMEQRRHIRE